MTESTVNDYEADNAVMAEVEDMLIEIGVYQAEAEPDFFTVILGKVLKAANDAIYKIFGAKGFFDR